MAGMSLGIGLSIDSAGLAGGGALLLGGIEPTLVLQFDAGVFACRELGAQDYRIGGSDPLLVTDFSNNTFGA